jgi:hypothetical protein
MKFSVLLPLGAALSFFCRFGFCSECIASDSRFELPPIGFSDTFRAKAETIVDESARPADIKDRLGAPVRSERKRGLLWQTWVFARRVGSTGSKCNEAPSTTYFIDAYILKISFEGQRRKSCSVVNKTYIGKNSDIDILGARSEISRTMSCEEFVDSQR